MEPTALRHHEQPSAARRRLSSTLFRSDVVEDAATVMARRGSSITTAPSLAETAKEDKVPSTSKRLHEDRRRISVKGHRASTLSSLLAMSSVSPVFVAHKVRPTLINAMVYFTDPAPDIQTIRALIAERLLSIPRFRSVVRLDDTDGCVHFDPLPRDAVDLQDHVRVIDGKGRFGKQHIDQLLSDDYLHGWSSTTTTTTTTSSSKPLWHMVLVQNLAEGRSILLITIDHAIGDGMGLLSLCLSLFDDVDEKNSASPTPDTTVTSVVRPKPTLSWSHATVAFAAGIYDGIVNTLLPELTADPFNCFMIPPATLRDDCPGKQFAETRAIPVADFKRMKQKIAGATLNDVIVSVIGRALLKYLEQTNDPSWGKLQNGRGGQLRAQFAVNMRRGTEGTGVNVANCAAVASFPFPTTHTMLDDPIGAVWACKTRGDTLKHSPAFFLRQTITDVLLRIVPAGMIAPKLIQNVNVNTCFLSNVRGPAGQASFAGYAIDDLNFVAQGAVGLYVGIITFGGKLHVTLTKDERTHSNIEELRDLIEACYEELDFALRDVDPTCPLKFTYTKPWAAKLLEWLVYSAVVVGPVWLATQYFLL